MTKTQQVNPTLATREFGEFMSSADPALLPYLVVSALNVPVGDKIELLRISDMEVRAASMRSTASHAAHAMLPHAGSPAFGGGVHQAAGRGVPTPRLRRGGRGLVLTRRRACADYGAVEEDFQSSRGSAAGHAASIPASPAA